jgi:hypothetical protein
MLAVVVEPAQDVDSQLANGGGEGILNTGSL